MKPCVIYCADIGSVAKCSFAWARGVGFGQDLTITGKKSICEFVDEVAKDLNAGDGVAMGFECPLFVPISDDPARLTSARNGEGSRPWSAGAGAAALATGLTETVWILREIRRQIRSDVPAFVSWPVFREVGHGLFLWEAFVTSPAKGETNIDDAKIAVCSFAAKMPDILTANAIYETSVHSLIGAALLRTGWSTELSLLETPCVVIKA
jgi:hypothetical protein